MNFSHLHVHTDYSLLDGLIKIEKLFERVKELGMDSVAITDHGVLYGVAEFWQKAQDFNIKPIIGCEVYVSPKERTLREPVNGVNYYHLILLVKDLVGYKNLVKLVSKAQLEGMYYRPRVDMELLKKHSEGLICSTACLSGPVAKHIIRSEDKKALEWFNFLNTVFKDSLYLELQRNGFNPDMIKSDEIRDKYEGEELRLINEQIKVNNRLREISDKYKVPLLATADAHYLNKEDRDVQTVLFGIRDGKKLQDHDKRIGYLGTYIKSPEEMYRDFADDITPLENSLKISEQITEFSLKFKRVQPKYLDLPKNTTAEKELKKQTYEGANKKYKEVTKELKERIDYELAVIGEKGFNDYFLIVGDIMQEARKRGMIVGVRGSAAGCVVSYCLDITNVDPIKWELYFERFLNRERPSPPDIDMDFQDDRRDEIVNYVREKYGNDNVASICAIGSMMTKAAIRDVARVMDVDLKIADKLSKKVQVVFGKIFPIQKMMEVDSEFAAIINSSPKLQQLKDTVSKIEGVARHMSRHACGFLITPKPIIEYTALQPDSKEPGQKMTQLDGTWIDKLDFMKFDFLGLRTMTIVKNALNLIEEYHDVKIDLNSLSETDKKAFELFGRGETVGVFQFESPPMQQYLKDLQPENLEDICFLAAAYRPGPMKYIPNYIACKHGEKKPEYLVPELEPILNASYGFPIYQEQLLRICMKLGGFTMGEGDILRNALKKKKLEILEKKWPDFRDYFTTNFNYDTKTAEKLWDQLTPFADYGFNKAHSAGYAVIAYWCAYLKAHYPLEFMAALLHSDIQNLDRVAIAIREVKRLGFILLPPNINKSKVYFTVEGKESVRFGLGAIKNVGLKICDLIVEERNKNGEFRSFDNFVERVGPEKLNKRVVESLIKAGALDDFGEKNALLEILQQVFKKVNRYQNAMRIGQSTLFQDPDGTHKGSLEPTLITNSNPADQNTILLWEKELLGIYLSSHPLDTYQKALQSGSLATLQDASNFSDGKQFKTIAIFNKIKHTQTKKDQKTMALVEIEDLDSRAEGVVFPGSFEKLAGMLNEAQPYLITGMVNFRNEKLNVIINNIEEAEKYSTDNEMTINICSETNEQKLLLLRNTISQNPGQLFLKVIYGDESDQQIFVKKIAASREVLEILKEYKVFEQ